MLFCELVQSAKNEQSDQSPGDFSYIQSAVAKFFSEWQKRGPQTDKSDVYKSDDCVSTKTMMKNGAVETRHSIVNKF